MRMIIKISVAATTAIVLLCVGFYFLFFHMRTSEQVVSVSPDGMYKCEVTERSNGSHCVAQIMLYRQRSSWSADWAVMDKREVSNDSACRSSYSIDWSFNEKFRSTGVTVFGDFGGPPFAGTILYRQTLEPDAKPGGSP